LEWRLVKSAPKIWIIPPDCPTRLIGTYDRKRSTIDHLNLKEGKRIEKTNSSTVIFESAPLADLLAYDCLGSSALVPLVSRRLASRLLEIASDRVQLVPAHVIAKNGSSKEYSFLNVIHFAECIDLERSLTKYMLASPKTISGFDRLVLKPDCLGASAFGRDPRKLSLLLVSEAAQRNLEQARFKGLYFASPEEFYPPRGAAFKGSNSRH
jgi:hypothetical protein